MFDYLQLDPVLLCGFGGSGSGTTLVDIGQLDRTAGHLLHLFGQRRDLGAIALFTPDGSYMYGAFDRTMRGHADIAEWLDRAHELQEDIHFTYELLATTPEYAINGWKADLIWKASGDLIRFDGIFQVYLNEDGLCTAFLEWWHSSPTLLAVNNPDGGKE